jgi:secreted trypsin-like serine protease
MRRPALALIFVALVALAAPATAMVGGAYVVPKAASRPEVMLVGSRGNFCTGVAVARDLILTAAHCVQAGADYKLVELDAQRQPLMKDTLSVARHPQFNLKTMLSHRATADIALVKLAAPLKVTPSPLMKARGRVAVGERFAVYGYGMSVRTDANTSSTLRAATLVATGQPGNLQLRLVDPATGGNREGLGACTGDSGAPVYQDAGGYFAVIGVVSWSTGPNGDAGCGGFTGVTPIELYRGWIVDTARKLGSPLAP